MKVSKTSVSSENVPHFHKGKFGHSARNSFACAASADEFEVNINCSPRYIKLRGQVPNKKENSIDSESEQFSLTSINSSDKTSWPDLTKLIPFHQRGHESKLEILVCNNQHLLEKDVKVGSKVKEIEDSSVFIGPLHASNYSCKTTECSSLDKEQFHGSAATVEVEKNFAKNTYKFHISSSRKPQVSSGTHYHINEMDNNANCDINGVAFKEEQMCGNHSATAGTSKVFYDVASSSNVKLTFEHLEKGKNLPMSQSKEQEITVGRSSNTSSNQRKKAWKEEKKRVREEETRRRMVAPKGQRVRLVSQEMLGVLVNRNAEKVPFFTNHTEAPAINEMEFPTVEESRKPRIKLNEDLSSGVRGDDQEGSRTDEVQVELSNLGSNNSYCDQSSNTEREAILPASSMSSRNRKRKDPIQIDLMNLIKVSVFLMCLC